MDEDAQVWELYIIKLKRGICMLDIKSKIIHRIKQYHGDLKT